MKRLTAIALVFVLLFCLTTVYAAAPGSTADPLISLSYIDNTFRPAVMGEANALINNSIGKLYGDTGKKLQDAYNGYIGSLGGYDGYTFAGAFTPVDLPAGTSAELVTGSTFVLVSGTATVQVDRGTVINISTGQEVSAPAALTANEKYFCAEDTVGQFIATSGAVCLIDGFYKSGGTVIVNPVLFNDVRSTDWYYGAVKFATDQSLFNGTSATTFEPQTSMSRGMFVTVLYRLAGKPAISSASAFSDVPASQYYYNAVVWANASGIVTGYDGRFNPNELVTREQMAAILHRYAQYAGYGAAYGNTSVFDSFPDKGSVSSYFTDAVKWSAYNGLIAGSGGKLLPKNTASRAEVAQIILNFCQKIIGV